MKKILFVNQDILPYVAETELATKGRLVPQKMQEAGYDIRTFMPRWGTINERRGQLHEVIRLSGLNISINDSDHPLIIKVASIPGTKVQVYFIDNDEFFTRKGSVADEDGNFFEDNVERAAFFARGVVSTINKLRWVPDVVHCQGWMSSLLPFFLKTAFKEGTGLENVKVVTSLFDQPQQDAMADDSKACILMKGIDPATIDKYNEPLNSIELQKIAIDYSDAVINTSTSLNVDLQAYLDASDKKVINCTEEDFVPAYKDIYEQL